MCLSIRLMMNTLAVYSLYLLAAVHNGAVANTCTRKSNSVPSVFRYKCQRMQHQFMLSQQSTGSHISTTPLTVY